MKAQHLCLDSFRNHPSPLIESILCLIPIKEAVRTSILSKKCRYTWTKIPKLLLDVKQMFDFNQKHKIYNVIDQVLLLHEGPIHEFTFILHIENKSAEIDRIITHVSRNNNTLGKFTLDLKDHSNLYILPLCIFSFHRLNELYLRRCDVYFDPTTFSGFGCLTSLYLEDVRVTTKTLLHLISKSPLLKSFTLLLSDIYTFELRYLLNEDNSTLTELFECLPVIEELTISYWVFTCFVDSYPRGFQSSLDHLKYLCVEGLHYICRNDLCSIFSLIRCSPKLEKLKLHMFALIDEADFDEADHSWVSDLESVTPEYYSNIWLENLNELEIHSTGNLKQVLDIVKLILAKSPMLTKVSLFPYDKVTKDEEMSISGILLHSPHASPMVKIIVKCNLF